MGGGGSDTSMHFRANGESKALRFRHPGPEVDGAWVAAGGGGGVGRCRRLGGWGCCFKIGLEGRGVEIRTIVVGCVKKTSMFILLVMTGPYRPTLNCNCTALAFCSRVEVTED